MSNVPTTTIRIETAAGGSFPQSSSSCLLLMPLIMDDRWIEFSHEAGGAFSDVGFASFIFKKKTLVFKWIFFLRFPKQFIARFGFVLYMARPLKLI